MSTQALPKGVSLERLEALVLVDSLGSIAQAAGRDPTRQSQMSRQLRELGAAFGVPLTRKVRRGVQLTAAGRQLAVLARGFFHGLGAFVDEVGEAGRVHVAVGAGDSMLQALVVPALARVVPRQPGLEVSLAGLPDQELVRALEREELDAVLLRHAPPATRWARHRVADQAWALYAPAGSAGRSAEAVLAAVPLALQTADGDFAARVLDAAPGARVALRCGTFAQAREAVRSGAFATVLPVFMEHTLPRREVRRLEWPALARRDEGLWWTHRAKLEAERPQVGKALTALRDALRAVASDAR